MNNSLITSKLNPKLTLEKKFFSLIPNIYCISFITSFKRRKTIGKLFSQLNIDSRVTYVYAKPDSEIQCSCRVIFNHLEIYKQALKEQLSFICIFEDDAYLSRPITQLDIDSLNKIISSSTNSWEVLLLGYDENIYRKGRNLDKQICHFQGLHSHAYIISNSGMKNFVEKFRLPIHPLHIGVIDSYFLISKNIYAFDNPIFIQEDFRYNRKTNNPVKFWIFYLFNYFYWNKMEFLGISLMLTVILIFYLIRK